MFPKHNYKKIFTSIKIFCCLMFISVAVLILMDFQKESYSQSCPAAGAWQFGNTYYFALPVGNGNDNNWNQLCDENSVITGVRYDGQGDKHLNGFYCTDLIGVPGAGPHCASINWVLNPATEVEVPFIVNGGSDVPYYCPPGKILTGVKYHVPGGDDAVSHIYCTTLTAI